MVFKQNTLAPLMTTIRRGERSMATGFQQNLLTFIVRQSCLTFKGKSKETFLLRLRDEPELLVEFVKTCIHAWDISHALESGEDPLVIIKYLKADFATEIIALPKPTVLATPVPA